MQRITHTEGLRLQPESELDIISSQEKKEEISTALAATRPRIEQGYHSEFSDPCESMLRSAGLWS